MSKNDFRFSRRDVREYCGWGNTQIKIHFKRLEDLEYLIVHRGGRGQTFSYELLYDGEGKEGDRFLMRLIDIEEVKRGHEEICYSSYRDDVGCVGWVCQ